MNPNEVRKNIMSMYSKDTIANDIEKSEGSRGGKVIGHTKSGKPIYEKHEQEHTQHYTHEDHGDAMSAHMLEAKKHNEKLQGDKSPDTDENFNKREKLIGKIQNHSQMAQLHQGAMNSKMDAAAEDKISAQRGAEYRQKRMDKHVKAMEEGATEVEADQIANGKRNEDDHSGKVISAEDYEDIARWHEQKSSISSGRDKEFHRKQANRNLKLSQTKSSKRVL